jgi:hypothetical protein
VAAFRLARLLATISEYTVNVAPTEVIDGRVAQAFRTEACARDLGRKKQWDNWTIPRELLGGNQGVTPSFICSALPRLKVRCRQSSMCLHMFLGLMSQLLRWKWKSEKPIATGIHNSEPLAPVTGMVIAIASLLS